MNNTLSKGRMLFNGTAAFVVILALWELVCVVFSVRPVLVPRPSAIGVELASNFTWYMGHSVRTLLTTVVGFAMSVVVGVALAIFIVSSRRIESYIYPLLVASNSVPKVAIAPLMVIWLGTGPSPKIAIAFLLSVFAIMIDSIHGLRAVPQDIIDLGRVLKGSPVDFFWKVKFPSALPFIMSGMKVAIALALVGAIVGEFVAAQAGLGYVIMTAQGMFDTVRVFAAIFILAIMGMILFFIIGWLDERSQAHRHR